MNIFKGLKVPPAPALKSDPTLLSCHCGGGDYCRNIACDECVFSIKNEKIRLEYWVSINKPAFKQYMDSLKDEETKV